MNVGIFTTDYTDETMWDATSKRLPHYGAKRKQHINRRVHDGAREWEG